MRVSSDVMPGRYRHFKGGSTRWSSCEGRRDRGAVVVYQALYGEQGHWVRSLAEFTAHVSRDGYEGPRFVRHG